MTTGARIALLLPDLRLGGAQRVLLMLAREFIALGLQVDIIVLVADGPLMREVPAGVRLVRPASNTTLKPVLAVTGLWRLIRYLRVYRPQALLSTMTGANLIAVAARTLSRQQTTLVVREAASLRNLGSARILRWLVKLAYPKADRVVAVSEGVAGELAGMGVPRHKLITIANPVDRERMLELAAKAGSTPAKPGTGYLISIGRLIPQKNHALLLRAFASSRAKADRRLVLVGDGPLQNALQEQARQLGIAANVDFPGAVTNPYGLLLGAEALVLSSRWEGHPNVLLEALALGVPVIATDCPHGPREILEGVSGSVLVPMDDVEALRQAMDEVVENANSQRSFGAPCQGVADAARQYLSALFEDPR